VGRRGGRGGADSAGNPSLAISYSGIPCGVQRTPRDTRGDTAGGTPSANSSGGWGERMEAVDDDERKTTAEGMAILHIEYAERGE